MSTFRSAALVVMLLSAAGGCGGGTAGGAKAKDEAADPLAAAEAELAAAEGRVARVVGPSAQAQKPTEPGPQAVPEPSSPGQLPGQAPRPAGVPQRIEGESAAGASDDDTCESACDALHAMQKAADRICELAPGERCDAARARLADAEKRVQEACPECDA